MAKSARKGGWPEKNPESGRWPMLTTPMSTDGGAGEPGPSGHVTVPDNADPGNPVGYSMGGSSKKGKGRK